VSDKKKEERLLVALMVFVLISLLFFSPVAFGQSVSVSSGYGAITGTVYSNDGVSPLLLNDADHGSCLELFNTTTGNRTAWFDDDASGLYTSKPVPAGSYILKAFLKDALVGNSTVFTLNDSEIKTIDLQTSRMPTN
jgi:hypothetical protein